MSGPIYLSELPNGFGLYVEEDESMGIRRYYTDECSILTLLYDGLLDSNSILYAIAIEDGKRKEIYNANQE
jgi:hypothetical protein